MTLDDITMEIKTSQLGIAVRSHDGGGEREEREWERKMAIARTQRLESACNIAQMG